MRIYLRETTAGLLFARAGRWTQEVKEARLFQNVKEALLLALGLDGSDGPLELFYDLGDPSHNFAISLSAALAQIITGASEASFPNLP